MIHWDLAAHAATFPTLSIVPDAEKLLESFGPWVLIGLFAVLFIESGVLFPFLPGDSLIVTAAILAGPLGITWWQILLVGIPAAFLGDQVGYFLGRRFGRRLFKDDARILKTSHLEEAEAFFRKYGGVSLVLGRFVPIVRTYVPLAAGTAAMPYRRFLLWNIGGGVLWVGSMTLVGALLGGIPLVRDNIDILAIVIVLVSVLPIVIGAVIKARKSKREGTQA
ncbi:hypothetical protein GCM10010922_00420 [Microbacterium sorbitolivorans]|uniref:DedA family protein n=1 Tax=Microbacterium sorbitolivorans TaxID=1867410 RepID=UPI0019BD1AA6|nr:hypothetical protein GCM10010922_00420 [Microbacterium sorbitolivorans]